MSTMYSRWLLAVLFASAVAGGCGRGKSPSDDSESTVEGRAAADGVEAARALVLERTLSSSSQTPSDNATAPADRKRPDAQGFIELDWLEMMPTDELEALKNAPPVIHRGRLAMRQIGSYRTIAAVLGYKVKLPGYVVPMETDGKGRMTSFFFVPFFGACIHVPPPPPNQIVFARLSQPIPTPEVWEPYWLKGILQEETTQSGLAGSAYVMSQAALAGYEG